MTPLERACKMADGDLGSSTGEFVGILARAIRAAENDALERAALACESDAEENGIDYYERMRSRSAADTIRALKHKDVE